MAKLMVRMDMVKSCCHSIEAAYKAWQRWQETQDRWCLKEAIIWAHHGVELALKAAIAEEDEFLVFDDVDKAANLIIDVRHGEPEAPLGALFELENSPHTVGIDDAIRRARALLQVPELADGHDFRESITSLTSYRNKLMHSGATVEPAAIADLIVDVVEPLAEILPTYVPTARINVGSMTGAEALHDTVASASHDSEEQVAQLMERFAGQEVPGDLLGAKEAVTLPAFTRVDRNVVYEPAGGRVEIDVVGAVEDEVVWVTEVKLRAVPVERLWTQLKRAAETYSPPAPNLWAAIVLEDVSPRMRQIAWELGMLISGQQELAQLSGLLA